MQPSSKNGFDGRNIDFLIDLFLAMALYDKLKAFTLLNSVSSYIPI